MLDGMLPRAVAAENGSTTVEFLSTLRARDVRCWLEGDHLRLSAPRQILTPGLQEELARRKAEIVAFLRSAQSEAPGSIVPRAREGGLPLSFAQERMWFLQKLDPQSVAYNLQTNIPLRGPLDASALQRAMTEILRRHEVLRTTFVEKEGRPIQLIAVPGPAALPLADLSRLEPAACAEEASRLATEDVRRPFDLERGPVFRPHLLRLGEEDHQLLITQHHIVTDGWSIALLIEEVLALYRAFAAGQASPLPEPRLQYGDFAAWQRDWLRGKVLEGQLAYWRAHLAGPVPVLDLPTDGPRPRVQTVNGAIHAFDLPGALTDRLRALSRAEGATPFMTLLAAFVVLLSRWSGQEDVVVGTASGNRPLLETEGMLGLFVNTLALRTDLSGDPSFREALGGVRTAALGAYAHGDLPFEKLVEELRPVRDLSRSPLAQVLFVMQNTPLEALSRQASPGAVIGDRATASHDLSLYLTEGNSGLRGELEYNTDLFRAETAQRFARHYRRLLEAIVEDPGQRISRLPVMDEAERQQVVVTWNDTTRAVPRKRVHELVAEQAARRPDETAVVADEASLTYAELDRRVRRLARRLGEHGVGPGQIVGLCVERSVDMVTALLAVLEAGAAYMPLDPLYPGERLAFMLGQAEPAAILTQTAVAGRLPPSSQPVLLLDEEGQAESEEPESGRRAPGNPEPSELAYVLFTSGSTGRPKGVAVTHAALTNLVAAMRETTGITERDTVLATTTLAFDIAGLELFLPLIVGGRVVLASREAARDGLALCQLLVRVRPTFMQATPATWRMLIESGWQGDPDLTVICGGEALASDLARALRGRCRAVWNGYGPTETTIYSTVHPVGAGEGPIPIGRPLANTRVHVLDRHQEPLPAGCAGELYIGGIGVARGYLGRPDLTAERFVPDPFAAEPGARLYRTGDLTRFHADGVLEYLGRLDTQIKLRGFRIELGEIEAVLREQPSITDAAVVAQDHGNDKRLVAYVAFRPGQVPSMADLRRALGCRLPEHMIPSTFVALPALPLSPNGKVDRRGLPASVFERPREIAFVPPRSPVEEAVAGIWREVLGIEQVGVHDDFFDLGGHSLTGTQVLARVQDAFGVQLPLRRIFESPSVAGLAGAVEAAGEQRLGPEAAPLVPVARDRDLALSFAQERLWFLHQLEEASAAYHIPGALLLRGCLDVGALDKALAELWRRHESLRTRFESLDGQPVQRIDPPDGFSPARHDLSALGRAGAEAQARRLTAEEAQRPFDLVRGPLFRVSHLRLAEDEHVLLVTLHHVVADGWSLGVLVRELGVLYEAFRCDRPSPLSALPLQYADFAQWQRARLEAPEVERQIGYWRRQLQRVSALELPTDRPRPPVQTFHGANHHFLIAPEVAEGVRRLARREKATVFMVLLAAFQSLLHRYSGQEDVAVGTPVAGRSRAELEGLVGLFVNTLVLRTDLGGDPRFRDVLARVREVALEAYAHQDTPFERLVEELRPERDLSRSPLFQVMLVLQNAPAAALDLPGLSVQPWGAESGASRFDLTLFVTETSQGFFATAEYNTDLFDADRVAGLGEHFQTLLAGAVSEPDRRLSELPLLEREERRRILGAWNQTARRVSPSCVHERIALQAAANPEALAVSFEGASLSYRALDAASDALARRLVRMGVGPEVLVGVAVERSLDLVVALLGVLKAGGAYLPLDPTYPKERLAFMLEDSGARVLLTEEPLLRLLPSNSAQVLCLDSPAPRNKSEAVDLLPVDPDQLAYVIYTSGSTGRPKGVQVSHRSLSNFLDAMAERPGLAPSDVLLSVTTLSFDIAGLELYLPLVTGARVEMVSREAATNGAWLLERLVSSGATVMQATPATWRLLLEGGWAGGPLRALCGGEALPGDLASELLKRGVTLWNLYGPTETTIWSTTHRVERAEGVASLGRPIANTRLYVLDPKGEPVPVGVPGELYIGGAGLARGYLNRPDLTAERFLPDLFGGEPGARLYRTGDLVRYRRDGALDFLGRVDQQVKVRGFRIELGEIEVAMRELKAVKAAVVLTRPNGTGEVQLVAHVVFRPGLELTVTELRGALKEKLPPHMIPSSFVILDDLPLTPNGKVDRKALARLEARQREGLPGHVAPRTPLEKSIAAIWQEALGVPRISRHDNFFDLGGHSLLSMRVLARIEAALGIRLTPRDLIFQTLEQLAALCERQVAGVAGSRT
ncbi:MAG TPA: amino acid adenylation domain-containing protein [Vicinamibacteria bacterium]|jgi:amino acid adenylation domain-containing protein|nr:amino acid adenylation domain-containing protein [Vicinamibacteria bacterium]